MMVTPVGITDLGRGFVVEFVFPYILWFLLPRETLDARDLVMEKLFAFSLPWGHRLGAGFCLGSKKGGMLSRLLAEDAAWNLATMMRRTKFVSRLRLRLSVFWRVQ
jgi:hypothetical protein